MSDEQVKPQVNIQNVVERILAIQAGQLPQDAVTVEELKAALQAQRDRFGKGIATSGDGQFNSSTAKRGKSSGPAIVIPDTTGSSF